jgi:large subunit ribosomal protein L4
MKLTVLNTTGKNTNLTVKDEVFGSLHPIILTQAVRVYRANQRQSTSKTKTRSEVNRTTRKWYRQKGTGNARHGAKDANIFVGGGVSHGPTGLENWKLKLTTVLKKKSLTAALSAQVKNIAIVKEIDTLTGKTKEAYQLLTAAVAKFGDKKLSFDRTKLLVIVDEKTQIVKQALRNLPRVELISASQVNAYYIAKADKIIMTKKAVEVLQARLSA